MTDDSKATPRPWFVSGVRTRLGDVPILQICGPDDKMYAAVLYGDGSDAQHFAAHADANLIVTAVNAHDALVAERNRLRQQVEDLEADASNDYGKYLALKHDYDRLRQALEEAREAINIAVRILPRAWLTGSSVSFAEWEAGWQKIDVALARIREVLGDSKE